MSALLLTRAEIAGLMAPADYLRAVEAAFRAFKKGLAESPLPLGMHGEGGGVFHAKGAVMHGERKLAALKLNGNFPHNPARGLPTVQGVMLLCDGQTGALLAIMDAMEITKRRTAAATALAAKHLAKSGAKTLALIGCGGQARAQVEALCEVLPLVRGVAFDADRDKARAFALEMSGLLPFTAASSLREAAFGAEVIVTCTTSRSPFLEVGDVAPGAFIAAVGADSPQKGEIAPALMSHAVIVADVLAQCVLMGDTRHAVQSGAISPHDVRAELGDLVVGAKAGRASEAEIVIFDSTGSALQDAASAALLYERAIERGVGRWVDLA